MIHSVNIIIIFVFCVLSLSYPHTALAQKRTIEEQIEFLVNRLDQKTYLPMFEKTVQDLITIGVQSVPSIIEVAKDRDETDRARINAVYTLGRLGRVAEQSVFALTQILKSKYSNNDLRAAAATALGRIGRPSATAIPTLARYLDHEDSWVRLHAERALENIGTRTAKQTLKQHKARLKAIAEGIPLEEIEAQEAANIN